MTRACSRELSESHTLRAAGLYDRRNDQVSLDEVERILI
jgi:hypothetical protein